MRGTKPSWLTTRSTLDDNEISDIAAQASTATSSASAPLPTTTGGLADLFELFGASETVQEIANIVETVIEVTAIGIIIALPELNITAPAGPLGEFPARRNEMDVPS